MANVKLVHTSSGRKVEVPEASAGPYLDLGWEKQSTRSTSTSGSSGRGKAKTGTKAEATVDKSGDGQGDAE